MYSTRVICKSLGWSRTLSALVALLTSSGVACKPVERPSITNCNDDIATPASRDCPISCDENTSNSDDTVDNDTSHSGRTIAFDFLEHDCTEANCNIGQDDEFVVLSAPLGFNAPLEGDSYTARWVSADWSLGSNTLDRLRYPRALGPGPLAVIGSRSQSFLDFRGKSKVVGWGGTASSELGGANAAASIKATPNDGIVFVGSWQANPMNFVPLRTRAQGSILPNLRPDGRLDTYLDERFILAGAISAVTDQFTQVNLSPDWVVGIDINAFGDDLTWTSIARSTEGRTALAISASRYRTVVVSDLRGIDSERLVPASMINAGDAPNGGITALVLYSISDVGETRHEANFVRSYDAFQSSHVDGARGDMIWSKRNGWVASYDAGGSGQKPVTIDIVDNRGRALAPSFVTESEAILVAYLPDPLTVRRLDLDGLDIRQVHAMVADGDDGLIVLGTSRRTFGQTTHLAQEASAVAVRLDADFNALWKRTYPDVDMTRGYLSLAVDSQEGQAVVGANYLVTPKNLLDAEPTRNWPRRLNGFCTFRIDLKSGTEIGRGCAAGRVDGDDVARATIWSVSAHSGAVYSGVHSRGKVEALTSDGVSPLYERRYPDGPSMKQRSDSIVIIQRPGNKR